MHTALIITSLVIGAGMLVFGALVGLFLYVFKKITNGWL